MSEVQLDVKNADFLGSGVFPEYVKNDGTNIPVAGLAYDDTAQEYAFWRISARNFSSSLSITIEWYADTASTGTTIWGIQVAAITPNTDTQDIETDALDTETTDTDTHLGTTNQRLHSITIAIGADDTDGLSADDDLVIRIRLLNTGTMAGDAILTKAIAAWTDA